jgi:hypothetical protein
VGDVQVEEGESGGGRHEAGGHEKGGGTPERAGVRPISLFFSSSLLQNGLF